MAKVELKTRQNAHSVPAFLKPVNNPQQRADSLALVELMQEIIGEPPRKQNLTLYLGCGSEVFAGCRRCAN